MSAPDCRCETPNRPTGKEPERLKPWECLTCGGFACEYADQGQTRCSMCDCFIEQYPESPRDLHPEAFVVAPLPIHRTEAGYPSCSTCDGGGCYDCTDPA